MTHSQIENKITDLLKIGGSNYFNVEGIDGEIIKIRVSDHAANSRNNGGKTLSFIAARTNQRKSSYNKMVDEWVIDEDGYTDTYQSIKEILDWNDVLDCVA